MFEPSLLCMGAIVGAMLQPWCRFQRGWEASRKKVSGKTSGKTRTEVKDKLKSLDAVPGLINRARSPPAPLTALLYTITQGG
jgi:hypothetical protein